MSINIEELSERHNKNVTNSELCICVRYALNIFIIYLPNFIECNPSNDSYKDELHFIIIVKKKNHYILMSMKRTLYIYID